MAPGPAPGTSGPGTVAAGPGDDVDPTNDPPMGDPPTGDESGTDTADDRDERLFELQASNARFELNDRTLTEEERVTQLRALSQRFLGTMASCSPG